MAGFGTRLRHRSTEPSPGTTDHSNVAAGAATGSVNRADAGCASWRTGDDSHISVRAEPLPSAFDGDAGRQRNCPRNRVGACKCDHRYVAAVAVGGGALRCERGYRCAGGQVDSAACTGGTGDCKLAGGVAGPLVSAEEKPVVVKLAPAISVMEPPLPVELLVSIMPAPGAVRMLPLATIASACPEKTRLLAITISPSTL